MDMAKAFGFPFVSMVCTGMLILPKASYDLLPDLGFLIFHVSIPHLALLQPPVTIISVTCHKNALHLRQMSKKMV